jgi:hypothetical protein
MDDLIHTHSSPKEAIMRYYNKKHEKNAARLKGLKEYKTDEAATIANGTIKSNTTY